MKATDLTIDDLQNAIGKSLAIRDSLIYYKRELEECRLIGYYTTKMYRTREIEEIIAYERAGLQKKIDYIRWNATTFNEVLSKYSHNVESFTDFLKNTAL